MNAQTDATLEEVIEVAVKMAEDLQEFVSDAIAASNDENALKGTQDLLEDWESVFSRTPLSWKRYAAQGDETVTIKQID